MPFARLFRHEAGQSIVELALAAPILVFALIGGIDLMRVAAINQAVQNAARVGVEVASGNNDSTAPGSLPSDLLTDMTGELSSTPGLRGVTVQQSGSCTSDNPCATLPGHPANRYLGTCYTATGALCSPAACDHSAAGAICYLQINVQYTFKTLVPWPYVPNQISVNRTAAMPILKTQ